MHIALIYMASGFSRRFGGNKLLAPLAGIPLYRHGFDHLQDAARRIESALSCSCRLYVVCQYDEILSWCRAHDAIAVKMQLPGKAWLHPSAWEWRRLPPPMPGPFSPPTSPFFPMRP